MRTPAALDLDTGTLAVGRTHYEAYERLGIDLSTLAGDEPLSAATGHRRIQQGWLNDAGEFTD
jgi:hypothetical protein